jgi:hypothetical protein
VVGKGHEEHHHEYIVTLAAQLLPFTFMMLFKAAVTGTNGYQLSCLFMEAPALL